MVKEMLCQNCGTANTETDLFCHECGIELIVGKQEALPHEAILTPDPFQIPSMSVMLGQSEKSDPLIGKVIDNRYRIESKVGVGGMGAVYRATRLLIGDEVAIKILHSAQNADSTTTERFRREAQSAARLKHPNAVTIYDFGVSSEGLQYLVMDLVEGESLREIIKKRGPLTPTSASEIIRQVCAALDAAQQQGVIHRDIKPDNIIVNSTASGLRVKVLDFGIAKLRDHTASNLTQTGSVMGTPHYMSPEQCLGEELDSRSDIYSLGVVLYEMLCGVVPFKSPTSTAVVIQHVNQPPPSLRSLNLSIPMAVEAVVLHALEKRREARPQTAGELSRELDAAVMGEPPVQKARLTSENPLPGSYQTPGFMPTVVMNTPQSGSHFSSQRLTASAPQGNQRSSSRIVMLTVIATVLLLGIGGGSAWILFGNKSDDSDKRAKTNVNKEDPTRSNANRQNDNYSASTTTVTTSTPVSTPSPAMTPSSTNIAAARSEVMAVMNQWVSSLNSRDLYGNLRLYADHLDTFYQLFGVDKDKVSASRRAAFTRFSSSVNVELSDVRIDFDSSGTTATVDYDNTYDWRGGTRYLTGKSHNEIIMSKINGEWLITSEKHISTYYENKGN
jgi:serine/threonine protein kinase